VDETKSITHVREGLVGAKTLKNGTITATFKKQGKGKVTFMAHQHTYKETRYVSYILSDTY